MEIECAVGGESDSSALTEPHTLCPQQGIEESLWARTCAWAHVCMKPEWCVFCVSFPFTDWCHTSSLLDVCVCACVCILLACCLERRWTRCILVLKIIFRCYLVESTRSVCADEFILYSTTCDVTTRVTTSCMDWAHCLIHAFRYFIILLAVQQNCWR